MLLSCTHLSHRLATHFGLLLSSLPPHSPMTKQELLCPPENRTGAVINKILLFIKIEVTGRVAMCQRNIWNLPLLPRALKATERDGGTSVKSDLNIRVANVSWGMTEQEKNGFHGLYLLEEITYFQCLSVCLSATDPKEEPEGSDLTQTWETLVSPGKRSTGIMADRRVWDSDRTQSYCPMSWASLFTCLSPQILTQHKCLSCLLFGSVLGRDCHKTTATILYTKNITHPKLSPEPCLPLSSLQGSSFHIKTSSYIKTQP